MKFMDRLLTIVVTATITSIIWILFGATWLDKAKEQQEEKSAESAPVAPSPNAPPIMEPADAAPVVMPTASPAPEPSSSGEPAAQPQMPPLTESTSLPPSGSN